MRLFGTATKPEQQPRKLPATPCGDLPPQMKVLFVAGSQRTGSWLAEAFASDRAVQVQLVEVAGIAAGLARLREEIFDAVLVGHQGQQLDSLELLDAIRTGSSDDQPIIVMGSESEKQLSDLCFEAGADDYVCVDSATTRTLIWRVARAMERHRLITENRQLEQLQQRRLQMEHTEATRLLQQQRGLISDLEKIQVNPSTTSDERPPCEVALTEQRAELPAPLVQHYRELLKTYVIMGSGNLTEDMQQLAQELAAAGVTARQAMLLHLQVLEEMVQSLGSRSARHVLSRADLLILEVIINLAEDYRQRLLVHLHPPKQLSLWGS